MDFGMVGAGAALGIAALGSAIGIGTSGSATIGAWKRCYMNNKPAPFILTVFAGAPLTQTIYGYLVMMFMMASSNEMTKGWFGLGLGIAAGLAMAFSAVAQGKAGAAGSDAFGETGKGFAQFITVVGLCETVALFVMVFSLISV
ncbi:MAG: V-type ATP synthase subunit K [Treponemataceae bacterium]